VLVGDVVLISAGDIIPADGIMIEGHGVKCDESWCTGESDLMPKVSGDEVFTILDDAARNRTPVGCEVLRLMDPFIHSGAKVQEGCGSFLATAVGINSSYGRTMMALRVDPDDGGPQTQRLHHLALSAWKLGTGAALLLLTASVIKFLAGLPYSALTPEEKGRSFFALLVTGIAVSVIAGPLFLSHVGPIVMTFARTRMVRDNSLVLSGKAGEVVGNVTSICTGVSGILTQNKMTVVDAMLGATMGFNDDDLPPDDASTLGTARRNAATMPDLVQKLSYETKQLLIQSIVINSTAFEGDIDGQHTFIGSKTEVALMNFSRDFLGAGPASEERHNALVLRQVPFTSQAKFMATTVRLPSGGFRVYVKGGAEIVLGRCARVIADPAGDDLHSVHLGDGDRTQLVEKIASYGRQSLRPIALSFRDFTSCPQDGQIACRDMTLLAIFGIRDPIRPGVPDAVMDCFRAGIMVRMVTGDNLATASAIARDIGLYGSDSPGNIVLEGPIFRRMDEPVLREVVPRLVVLARASAEDKRILVRILRGLGETVAVTGGGVDDGPALKMADIGFAMGIGGTEVAKVAADIILMDDNFCSIARCISWSRAAKDGVQKFLQVGDPCFSLIT
jgi:Ca2+-transporting ATPase